jgi:hypothetical protein
LFSEERVRKGADKLQKFLNSKQQGRLDGFFSVKPKEKASPKKEAKGKGKTDSKAKGTKRKVRLAVTFCFKDGLIMYLVRVTTRRKPAWVRRRKQRNDILSIRLSVVT